MPVEITRQQVANAFGGNSAYVSSYGTISITVVMRVMRVIHRIPDKTTTTRSRHVHDS
jgi:hypothetical protein